MKIGICICTCNRPQQLDRLLTILCRVELKYLDPSDVFIQIIDNAPDGRARAICERHQSSLPISLHFSEESKRGISFARNRAIAEALRHNAELIAFIDDDDFPRTDWLIRLIDVYRQTDSQIVFGASRPQYADLPDWTKEIKFFTQPAITGKNRFGIPQWASTSNVLLHRDMLDRMAKDSGLFRPEFALVGGGDMDFFVRAIRQGAHYTIAPESVVAVGWDLHRITLFGILRRAYRLGISRVCLDRYHLTPREYAKARFRRALSFPKLLGSLLVILVLGRKKRAALLAAKLFDIARRLGELSALMGFRFRYYR